MIVIPLTHTALCKQPGCEDWMYHDGSERLCQSAAAWHIYRKHREVWITLVGADRPPLDPDPCDPIARETVTRHDRAIQKMLERRKEEKRDAAQEQSVPRPTPAAARRGVRAAAAR